MANRCHTRGITRTLLIIAALVAPSLIIFWGELSEFNVNWSFLPTSDPPSAEYLALEGILLFCYFVITPSSLLVFFRFATQLKEKNKSFLALVIITLLSFCILRYLEYLYDTQGGAIYFGRFLPLVFWGTPIATSIVVGSILSLDR